MTQHLVITAVGSDRPGIGNQIIRLVTQSGCNIVDSRIAIFGNEFTIIMLLSGNTNSITRVETTLPLLGQEHELITMMKRTSKHESLSHHYTIEVIVESDDKVGLTEKFSHFFADRKIGISSLSAQTIDKLKIQQSHDQFHIHLTAMASSDCDMQQLHNEFDALCCHLGVKGILKSLPSTL
ncbi:glycine cleavage system transcriptional repressor [Vibrio sp. 10N.286.49.B3]|uniref:glycine cleavage system protein R n=1 Tax=Vibrio sp. 10N.286.49.B3 TaxID=1880855 RepID=UPI000C82CA6D|nr:ACT domain-containing protein [Vibrio sp. 10N.286.49.B3]PMH41285.1 glycine cleavage system transcriptional repressor [Vibrio sp. 10N.286.49.B3]